MAPLYDSEVGMGQGIQVPRYAIGTPGDPSAAMMRSVMHMHKPNGTPFFDATMSVPGLDKLDIASARNHLVEQFLTAHERYPWVPEPLMWFLQMDGDAVVHPGTLHRLQSWEVPCVGALCVTRYRPYQPVVYRGISNDNGDDMRSYYIQWAEVREWVKRYPKLMSIAGPAMLDEAPEDALHSVDWTGSHCFLCHRKVYEKIPPPWFEVHSRVKYGSGSDRIFFEKVKAAGIEVYVDYSVVAGHEAPMVLGMADFMAWQSISIEDSDGKQFVGDEWVKAEKDEGVEENA